jgi:PBP1b-binding outer membrane lipoprotein LpoB
LEAFFWSGCAYCAGVVVVLPDPEPDKEPVHDADPAPVVVVSPGISSVTGGTAVVSVSIVVSEVVDSSTVVSLSLQDVNIAAANAKANSKVLNFIEFFIVSFLISYFSNVGDRFKTDL